MDTVPPGRPIIQVQAPSQEISKSSAVFSGTAEPGSTVKIFVDGVQHGNEVSVNENGDWELPAPPLDWGTHTVEAKAVDRFDNASEPSVTVSFAMVRLSHYGMNCAAGPSALAPWGLLLVGLRRRRSRPSH